MITVMWLNPRHTLRVKPNESVGAVDPDSCIGEEFRCGDECRQFIERGIDP
ncbi:hypothetical protein ACK6D9_17425 [Hoeflea sp. Naph1]|uniref:hypothetical protein n=1 Tax=Hoeflea sp. Naph1 TaxID=3388653 RepID=UPI00398FF991